MTKKKLPPPVNLEFIQPTKIISNNFFLIYCLFFIDPSKACEIWIFIEKSTKCILRVYTLALDMTF
jgi:hypothetical protein